MLVEFTDYESNGEFKYQVGWFMTGLMILTTLTNVSCMIYTLISVLKEKVKSTFNNWQKQKKTKKCQEFFEMNQNPMRLQQINVTNMALPSWT